MSEYVYMVRSEYYSNGQVYNEAIFDSVEKAIRFINEWDLNNEFDDYTDYAITKDESDGEGVKYMRTIDYSMDWCPYESVELSISKYKINSVLCQPIGD